MEGTALVSLLLRAYKVCAVSLAEQPWVLKDLLRAGLGALHGAEAGQALSNEMIAASTTQPGRALTCPAVQVLPSLPARPAGSHAHCQPPVPRHLSGRQAWGAPVARTFTANQERRERQDHNQTTLAAAARAKRERAEKEAQKAAMGKLRREAKAVLEQPISDAAHSITLLRGRMQVNTITTEAAERSVERITATLLSKLSEAREWKKNQSHHNLAALTADPVTGAMTLGQLPKAICGAGRLCRQPGIPISRSVVPLQQRLAQELQARLQSVDVAAWGETQGAQPLFLILSGLSDMVSSRASDTYKWLAPVLGPWLCTTIEHPGSGAPIPAAAAACINARLYERAIDMLPPQAASQLPRLVGPWLDLQIQMQPWKQVPPRAHPTGTAGVGVNSQPSQGALTGGDHSASSPEAAAVEQLVDAVAACYDLSRSMPPQAGPWWDDVMQRAFQLTPLLAPHMNVSSMLRITSAGRKLPQAPHHIFRALLPQAIRLRHTMSRSQLVQSLQALSHTLAGEGVHGPLWSQLPNDLLYEPPPGEASLTETQLSDPNSWAHAVHRGYHHQPTAGGLTDAAAPEPIPARLAASLYLEISGSYFEPHAVMAETLLPASQAVATCGFLCGSRAHYGPKVSIALAHMLDTAHALAPLAGWQGLAKTSRACARILGPQASSYVHVEAFINPSLNRDIAPVLSQMSATAQQQGITSTTTAQRGLEGNSSGAHTPAPAGVHDTAATPQLQPLNDSATRSHCISLGLPADDAWVVQKQRDLWRALTDRFLQLLPVAMCREELVKQPLVQLSQLASTLASLMQSGHTDLFVKAADVAAHFLLDWLQSIQTSLTVQQQPGLANLQMFYFIYTTRKRLHNAELAAQVAAPSGQLTLPAASLQLPGAAKSSEFEAGARGMECADTHLIAACVPAGSSVQEVSQGDRLLHDLLEELARSLGAMLQAGVRRVAPPAYQAGQGQGLLDGAAGMEAGGLEVTIPPDATHVGTVHFFSPAGMAKLLRSSIMVNAPVTGTQPPPYVEPPSLPHSAALSRIAAERLHLQLAQMRVAPHVPGTGMLSARAHELYIVDDSEEYGEGSVGSSSAAASILSVHRDVLTPGAAVHVVQAALAMGLPDHPLMDTLAKLFMTDGYPLGLLPQSSLSPVDTLSPTQVVQAAALLRAGGRAAPQLPGRLLTAFAVCARKAGARPTQDAQSVEHVPQPSTHEWPLQVLSGLLDLLQPTPGGRTPGGKASARAIGDGKAPATPTAPSFTQQALRYVSASNVREVARLLEPSLRSAPVRDVLPLLEQLAKLHGEQLRGDSPDVLAPLFGALVSALLPHTGSMSINQLAHALACTYNAPVSDACGDAEARSSQLHQFFSAAAEQLPYRLNELYTLPVDKVSLALSHLSDAGLCDGHTLKVVAQAVEYQLRDVKATTLFNMALTITQAQKAAMKAVKEGTGGAGTISIKGFFDELAAALVGQLGSLTSAELVRLVPATASMPSTQRGLLLRNLARELATKVHELSAEQVVQLLHQYAAARQWDRRLFYAAAEDIASRPWEFEGGQVVQAMQALFTSNITSHKPYDDLVIALRWMQRQAAERAAAAAQAGGSAEGSGKASYSPNDNGGRSDCNRQRLSGQSSYSQREKARPLLFMESHLPADDATDRQQSSPTLAERVAVGARESEGRQVPQPAVASNPKGQVVVQPRGDLPLTLWQVQAIYNVLKGLDHPEAPAFGKEFLRMVSKPEA